MPAATVDITEDEAHGAVGAAASPRAAVLGGAAAGLLVVVALHAWRGESYWDYSEGVYALTSRMFLHGGDLYGRMIGAQPPGLFLSGAGILAIHDGVGWLRFVL
ncbi:MAG: hypothetical protein JWN32_4470, partial [Solirubrobacterales bacterium]|nr:hypothetical protein [Solirubrobacterales bacterium]